MVGESGRRARRGRVPPSIAAATGRAAPPDGAEPDGAEAGPGGPGGPGGRCEHTVDAEDTVRDERNRWQINHLPSVSFEKGTTPTPFRKKLTPDDRIYPHLLSELVRGAKETYGR